MVRSSSEESCVLSELPCPLRPVIDAISVIEESYSRRYRHGFGKFASSNITIEVGRLCLGRISQI
jgi:hypothetical protein